MIKRRYIIDFGYIAVPGVQASPTVYPEQLAPTACFIAREPLQILHGAVIWLLQFCLVYGNFCMCVRRSADRAYSSGGHLDQRY